MKNLHSKAVVASLLFAGLSLVSCKDKNSESEGSDATGTESYDTQGNTGETGNENMSPGADGGTGTVNDSTSVNGSGSTGTGGSNGSGSGTGSGSNGGTGTGSGNTGTGGTGTGSGAGNGTTRP